MKNVLPSLMIVLVMFISSIGMTCAYSAMTAAEIQPSFGADGYGLQWMMEYGNNPRTDARYQGPQPIGDSDNDGKNELLISGRDSAIRVMKWDENRQTYRQVRTLRPPFYPFKQCDAGGMAIGDVTNDGKNEIAATWYTSVYRYFAFNYRLIGVNPYIFFNGGGSADCLIGDCFNDGENELILSGGPLWGSESPVAQITVFKWNGLWLQRVAEWKDPDVGGYVFMAGLGDVDDDGLNEIVCAYANKVVMLKWDAEHSVFQPTVVKKYSQGQGSPFGVVCKDCDNDGKAEILLSYWTPRATIFKWNGSGFEIQFDKTWPEGKPTIEGIDVGDTDDDGLHEVVVGAGLSYVLQWNGTTYVEKAVLPTFGWMAVIYIGDCDNDGKNEIIAGNVEVDIEAGEQFTQWVFKYGWGT